MLTSVNKISLHLVRFYDLFLNYMYSYMNKVIIIFYPFFVDQNKKRCFEKDAIPSLNLPVRSHDKVLTPAQKENIINRIDRFEKRQLKKNKRHEKIALLDTRNKTEVLL